MSLGIEYSKIKKGIQNIKYMGIYQSFVEQLKHLVFLHLKINTITTNEHLACFFIMFQLVFTCTVESTREPTSGGSVASKS